MKHEILYSPDNTVIKFTLNQGESVRAESDAMISMSDGVDLKTGFGAGANSGGILKNIFRSIVTGESFFTNVFTATASGQEVLLAPGLEGDIELVSVENSALYIQAKSFLAGDPDLTLDTKWQGARRFFSGESMFFMKASGHGFVVINAFGGLQKITVKDRYIVDTGHIVAFTEGLTYNITKSSAGWISSFLSGEGLVCEFQGQGDVYIQSRNPIEFGRFVGSKLKPIVREE